MTVVGKIVAMVLIHIVPLIIVPLIIVRILSKVIENQHEFSHDEQEEMKNDIKIIKTAMGLGKAEAAKKDED